MNLSYKIICVLALGFSLGVIAQETQHPPASSADKSSISGKVNVPMLRKIASQARQSKDYPTLVEAMRMLNQLRPYNSYYMYQLALGYALLDSKRDAYDVMLKMQRQGLSYDFNKTPDSENVRHTELYNYLNDLMVNAGQPAGKATQIVSLGSDIKGPAATAWDPTREKFLVGTTAKGLIAAIGKDGETTVLASAGNGNNFWGIYGLAVDADRNRLWATSAANRQFSDFDLIDKGLSVLLEFDLQSMKLINRHPVPVDGRPHSLGSLAVSSDGDVYMLDSVLPVVYRKSEEFDGLMPFFASKDLVSLRDIELSPDGKRLYLADYEIGILVIDLESKVTYSLGIPETLNVGGISAFKLWQNKLIMIQNGIQPERIMSLELDETGMNVTGVSPVVVALDMMDSPDNALVLENQLYFLANTAAPSRQQAHAPVIMASADLTSLPLIITPDIQRLMDQQKLGNTRTVNMPSSDGAADDEKK